MRCRDDAKIGLLSKTWRIAGLPDCFLGPCESGSQGDYGSMTWAVLVEAGEAGAGEPEPSGLNGVLVGDDDYITMRVLCVETSCHVGDAVSKFLEALFGEIDHVGALQIGLQLTRERLFDRCPGVTLPPLCDSPLGEVFVHPHGHARSCGYLLSGPEGSLERRRPDGNHRAWAQVAPDPPGLVQPVRG